MKKYFAAAVVAVMVFAFAAFAAQLNVEAGPFQAGMDDDLTCAELATVSYEGGPMLGPDLNFGVSAITVDFGATGGADCDGAYAHIQVNQSGLDDYASGFVGNNFAIGQIQGNSVTFQINQDSLDSGYVAVENLEEVSIQVKGTLTGLEADGYATGIFTE